MKKFVVMLTAQNSSKRKSQYKHELAQDRICYKLNPRISCLLNMKMINCSSARIRNGTRKPRRGGHSHIKRAGVLDVF